jgi:hypothetical protein
MLNVNQITTTLRGLPDQALQRYAMMHKGDPYILSLAVSESNQRKQLRAAGQGQAGATPQPKVADAAIAGMAQQQLPENQGIAQIPTPNMQNMADGGIAGYDEDVGMADGGMFNFAQAGGPVMSMAGGGVARYNGATGSVTGVPPELLSKYQQEATEMAMGTRMQFSPDVKAVVGQIQAAQQSAYLKEEQQRMLAGSPLRNRTQVSAPSVAPVASTPASDLILPYGQSKATNVLGNAPPAPPPPPPAPAKQQGLGSIAPSTKVLTPEQAKEQAGDFVDFEESRTALRKAESDQESQGARLRTMLADSLPKTPAMAGLEKLLDKQDAATGGEKDKAAGLALLSAGLAIAGGSSQYALQNLKEAIPAVAQYGDALKDIKKMERENMKMRGDIEQARRAESRDDTKLKLKLEEDIGTRKDNINKLGIDLTAKIAGTTADVATKIWSTSKDNESRIQAAVAGANASAMGNINFLERLGGADPTSALAKGFKMSKQEGAEPRLYSEYIKLSEDTINGAAFKQKYPTFEIFKEGYSGSGLQFAPPPANASILKPPKG